MAADETETDATGSSVKTLDRPLRSLRGSEGLGPTTSHVRLDQVHTDVITKITKITHAALGGIS